MKEGSTVGRGLEDFVRASWDGVDYDVTPVADAPLERADRRYLLKWTT